MIDFAQSVPFVHPAIAWGALATGLIPVVIHLWNRRRYRRIRWAAMRFLLAANRRSARRMWIERILLLLIRMAIITFFGLAVARPYLSASALSSMAGTRMHRTIVLDNALSMSTAAQGLPSRFERAKRAALQLLDSFPDRDGISLVTTSFPAEAVFDVPVYDRRLVRDRLNSLNVTERTSDVVGALDTVRDMLRASEFPATNRVVYLLTDLPRHTWVPEDVESPTEAILALRALRRLLGDVRENLVVARFGADVDNVAITRLAVDAPIVGLDLPVSVQLDIANQSDHPVRDITWRLVRDGAIVRTQTVAEIDPGGVAVAEATLAFSEPGTHAIEARLVDVADALPVDDARYLSVEVRTATPVLLVDGQGVTRGFSGASAYSGEAGFLATALAPGRVRAARSKPDTAFSSPDERVSPLDPKIIAASDLSSEPLGVYATVGLCNVSRLLPEQWSRLTRFVAGGGGLLVTGGNLVSIENYNRFGYAGGAGVLGVKFSGPPVSGDFGFTLDASGSGSSGRTGARVDDGRVIRAAKPVIHAITSVFAGQAASGLFAARVNHYLPIETLAVGRASEARVETSGRGAPRIGGPESDTSSARASCDVVLRITDGAPAMMACSFGAGRVVVFTTSVDLDWTNLPAKGDFVSLMYNAVSFVTPQAGARRNLSVGQTLTESLTATQSALPIRAVGPDGSAVDSRLIVSGDASVVTATPTTRVTLDSTIGGMAPHARDGGQAADRAMTSVRSGPSLAVRMGPMQRAGVYGLEIGMGRLDVAVNTDPRESDLHTVDRTTFSNAAGVPIRWVDPGTGFDRESVTGRAAEMSVPMLLLVAVLLFVEVAVARRQAH